MDGMDAASKLGIYTLVLARYKDLINEKETHSISEIRARVSPYQDFIRNLRDSLIKDMVPYVPKSQFMIGAERAMDYVRTIKTCEFAFTFWMEFSEMASLRFGTVMDKSILLSSLLRSLGSEDAKVLVSRRSKAFVKFSNDGRTYVFSPESGSLLMGDDAMKLFADDPVAYAFNDLVYENYEDS